MRDWEWRCYWGFGLFSGFFREVEWIWGGYIELGRYLIKTFTKPGDVVLDNACGSGSFLLSAILEDRNFIGIEKNEDGFLHKKQPIDYIKVCVDRIEETLKDKEIKESTLMLFQEPIAEYHTMNYL